MEVGRAGRDGMGNRKDGKGPRDLNMRERKETMEAHRNKEKERERER